MQTTGNKFEFTNKSGDTKVTYFPFPHGPLIAGRAASPTLDYSGPEGQLSFAGPTQITQEETPSGQLLSVVLKLQNDTGSTSFSLFLPPVNLGDTKSQHFVTYAVKAQHAGLVATPGPQITYQVECFHGTAESVVVAV
jgi:hypothetical protein